VADGCSRVAIATSNSVFRPTNYIRGFSDQYRTIHLALLIGLRKEYISRTNCFSARINCLSVPFEIGYVDAWAKIGVTMQPVVHPTVPVFEAIQQAKRITFVSVNNN
jgi:hypothetical protein